MRRFVLSAIYAGSGKWDWKTLGSDLQLIEDTLNSSPSAEASAAALEASAAATESGDDDEPMSIFT